MDNRKEGLGFLFGLGLLLIWRSGRRAPQRSMVALGSLENPKSCMWSL